jgi:hypothetical protein
VWNIAASGDIAYLGGVTFRVKRSARDTRDQALCYRKLLNIAQDLHDTAVMMLSGVIQVCRFVDSFSVDSGGKPALESGDIRDHERVGSVEFSGDLQCPAGMDFGKGQFRCASSIFG